MKSDLAKLLHGILDLLVLKALEERSRNAAGVARWIKERSQGAVDVGAGSLYTALHRLNGASFIEMIDRVPGTTPKAKIYEIKRAGRNELVRRARQWRQFSSTIKHIVGDEETRSTARLNLILMMALSTRLASSSTPKQVRTLRR